MRAIHLICRRDESGQLNNLARVEGDVWRSGYWDLDVGAAEGLIGGWVYLHPTKGRPSEFGGRVLAVIPSRYEDASRAERVVLEFRAAREGRGQRWRGKTHGLAWTGGVVPTSFPHEADASSPSR